MYFNPLAWARTDAVNVTVPGTGGVRVTDSNGAAVVAQLVTTASGRREVVFVATVPGIGFNTYFIETGVSCAASVTCGCAVASVVDVRQGCLKRSVSDATFTLQNDHVVATFSNATGAVLQLHSLDSDTTVDVTQGIYQYINGTGGAYILVRTTLMPSGCVSVPAVMYHLCHTVGRCVPPGRERASCDAPGSRIGAGYDWAGGE